MKLKKKSTHLQDILVLSHKLSVSFLCGNVDILCMFLCGKVDVLCLLLCGKVDVLCMFLCGKVYVLCLFLCGKVDVLRLRPVLGHAASRHPARMVYLSFAS